MEIVIFFINVYDFYKINELGNLFTSRCEVYIKIERKNLLKAQKIIVVVKVIFSHHVII